tara:strand:+ start:16 stop:417 length:402 start_codon:yes stop_codon:yes gene_type:complete
MFNWLKRLFNKKSNQNSVNVTSRNIFKGMLVHKNPTWPTTWGDKDIHPPQNISGRVRSWSNMNGEMFGDYKNDKEQLQFPGIVCIDWNQLPKDSWKNIQGYRIGFANEYWLSSDQMNKNPKIAAQINAMSIKK